MLYNYVVLRYKAKGVESVLEGCLPQRVCAVVCVQPPEAVPTTATSLTLAQQVQLRYEETHPVIYQAVSERVREWTEARNGSETRSKAGQFIKALLRIPIGTYRQHPSVVARTQEFGRRSTVEIDRELRDTENMLVRHIRRMVPYASRPMQMPTGPTPLWRMHTDRVRRFQKIRRAQRDVLRNADEVMEQTVYGCNPAKRIVRQLLAQWIGNSDSPGCVLGIEGPPGVGKTTFVREGLARCFGTRDDPHPFEFISLGGATRNSTLVGWTYTWLARRRSVASPRPSCDTNA